MLLEKPLVVPVARVFEGLQQFVEDVPPMTPMRLRCQKIEIHTCREGTHECMRQWWWSRPAQAHLQEAGRKRRRVDPRDTVLPRRKGQPRPKRKKNSVRIREVVGNGEAESIQVCGHVAPDVSVCRRC